MSSALFEAASKAPSDLALMLNSLRDADEMYKPSPFWEKLALEHVNQLEEDGFENFKRTINLKYFSWGMLGIFAHHIIPLGWWWLRAGKNNPLKAKIVEISGDKAGFNAIASRIYALHVALLYDRVRQDDRNGILRKTTESSLGNPIEVRIDNKTVVTQDLCNSVHEFIRASQFTDLSKAPTVLEIGAGYGRVASVFLNAVPGVKYWIVDIPPALYVSQRYLSEVFPGKKVFKFRPFSKFSDVEKEVRESDICFFSSNQIDLLPKKSADVSVCISNLHEMTKAQIEFYFKQVDRLTKGTFYSKQWMRSIAKENGFTISQDDYPVPSHWVKRFNSRHPIQSWFFESAYQIS